MSIPVYPWLHFLLQRSALKIRRAASESLQLVPVRGCDKLMSMKFNSAVFAALGVVLFSAFAGRAQTTAFTYQGQLNSGSAPATGLYDFRFRLLDVNSNIVAGPLTNSPTGVTNGAFIVTLNFGGAVFDGSDRWLEIAVRSNGNTSAYTVLAPSQQITSTPYAIRALNAANATSLQGTNIIGTIPSTNLPPNVAFLNSNQTFTAANTFSGVVTANNSANTFSGAFTGNALGATNLQATNLVGTLPDARLSSNVALQSNPALSFAGSVTATNFIGAGHGLTNVPGAFFWVTATANVPTSYPNVGYLCANETTPVTITLPASPGVGDVIKVAGVGGAGWIIAQNAGQSVLAGNLSDSIGQSWTPRVGSAAWSSVASSADGTALVATVGDTLSASGYIYTSTDSGATWTARDSQRQWVAVASSADGTKLVAANYTGSANPGIYTSANSGASWARQLVVSLCCAVASSADGTKLVAAINSGQLYTSANSGANWTARDSARIWSAVASSANGTNLAAAVNGGQIYTSTNSGANWTPSAGSQNLNWTALACSADGSRLLATASGGQVYLSVNGGATWTQTVQPAMGAWSCAASSADGSRLAIAYGDTTAGYVSTSSDSGATWLQRTSTTNADWSCLASSANGSMLVGAINGGFIYTSSQANTTTGTAGYLYGAQQSAIELDYAGNGVFIPLSHEGTIRAY